MADISQLLAQSGINAQQIATQELGMAVEQFGANPLNGAINSVLGTNSAPDKNDGSWYSSDFAASLANAQFRPKLKFLFRVEFLFKKEIVEKMQQYGGAAWKNNFTFLVKSVDRPKIDFEYDEVNKYNFRTKVLKSIKHRDLTMAFIDDVGNNVYEFFRFMMMLHSPITRRSTTSTQDITSGITSYNAGSGMEFSDSFTDLNDYAHRGVIGTDYGNAIQAIKLTQFFVQPTEQITSSTKQISFFFVNPRIVSFDLDEVNHETSDNSPITMQFDFDFLVMTNPAQMEKLDASRSLPPVGTAPGDSAPVGTSPGPSGNANPYVNLVAGVASRAAQKLTSTYVGSLTRKVPGLGSVGDTLSAGIANYSKNGILGAANQAFARPTRDVVVDNTTAGPDSADITVT